MREEVVECFICGREQEGDEIFDEEDEGYICPGCQVSTEDSLEDDDYNDNLGKMKPDCDGGCDY